MRLTYLLVFVFFLISHGPSVSCGHEGHSGARHRQTDVGSIVSVANRSSAHQAHARLENFTENVRATENGNVLLLQSNGLPEHGMMIGIRSWQQQVPLPQPYTGRNAWQIPLNPRLAQQPISARDNLMRGAIALAVNGVPIFNALNNRGEDAYLAGELDRWGGHCGRGDDYHYHTAPVHLEKIVGQGKPIAFALDGFPIFGYTEPDGSPVKNSMLLMVISMRRKTTTTTPQKNIPTSMEECEGKCACATIKLFRNRAMRRYGLLCDLSEARLSPALRSMEKSPRWTTSKMAAREKSATPTTVMGPSISSTSLRMARKQRKRISAGRASGGPHPERIVVSGGVAIDLQNLHLIHRDKATFR